MRKIFKNWKIIWLIIAVISVLITLFFLFNAGKNKQLDNNNNNNKEIQENKTDENTDYNIIYQIFDGENPSIQLYISSEKGML